MWWLKLIAPIITGAGSLFFVWRWIKKRYSVLSRYYHIVLVLVDAIEKIEQLTDIIPNNAVNAAKIIKRVVYLNLSKEDKEQLDDILKTKGYIKKDGGD